MQKDLLLELKDVYFTYGCHQVLRGLTLQVYRGDTLVVMGPNGAGKSTLLKVMAGILRPQRGKVVRYNCRVGYLPQRSTLINPSFPATVEEVVALGLLSRPEQLRLSVRRRMVRQVIEAVGLQELADKKIGTLSGGQMQKVLMARALVGEPSLLLLDEPATALDEESRQNMVNLLKRLQRDYNLALVIVTHNAEEVRNITTRRLCLTKTVCECENSRCVVG